MREKYRESRLCYKCAHKEASDFLAGYDVYETEYLDKDFVESDECFKPYKRLCRYCGKELFKLEWVKLPLGSIIIRK